MLKVFSHLSVSMENTRKLHTLSISFENKLFSQKAESLQKLLSAVAGQKKVTRKQNFANVFFITLQVFETDSLHLILSPLKKIVEKYVPEKVTLHESLIFSPMA